MQASNERGSGATTQQMKDAPMGAFFVWVNHHTGYAVDLAHSLGRSDLQVVPPSWLTSYSSRGAAKPVVVDHAVRLTDEQWHAFNLLKERFAVRQTRRE